MGVDRKNLKWLWLLSKVVVLSLLVPFIVAPIVCKRVFCILQYFRPSLNYHLSLRSLFRLFLNGCFTQVL